MAIKKTGATSPALDPKVADKLLDKLSTDNDFRRLFKKDPAAALVKAGHPKDAAALTGKCCQVQSIAPKAQILKSRDELKTMLAAGLSMTPVRLNTGVATARSKK
jgi:putative modified peptide